MSVSHLSPPTTAEVKAIAALADPVVRNLRITQCYHELAVAVSALAGPGVNWCTVATWASKQAGRSIRKEDPARALENLIDSSEDATGRCASWPLMGRCSLGQIPAACGRWAALWQAVNPVSAFQRSSDAVARGNRKVFEEIGYEFARFLALFGDGQPDQEKLAAFGEDLQAASRPTASVGCARLSPIIIRP